MGVKFYVEFNPEIQDAVIDWLEREKVRVKKSQNEMAKASKYLKGIVKNHLIKKKLWNKDSEKTIEGFTKPYLFAWKVIEKGAIAITIAGHPFIDYEDEFTARLLYKLYLKNITGFKYTIGRIKKMIKSEGFKEMIKREIVMGGEDIWQKVVNQTKADIERIIGEGDPNVKVSWKFI